MRKEMYQGSWQAYEAMVERNVEVPTRDGASLMTDIYWPALEGRPAKGPFPVLLCRTPYGRGGQYADAMFYARFGYVVVLQDWRQSQGDYDLHQWRPRHEASDGYDAIEWLASQPWSTGKVGMWGHSAMGQTVQAVLALSPPGLKSAYIIDTGLDYGAYPARQNGAFGQIFWLRYCLRMAEQLEKDPRVKKILRDAYLNPQNYFSCFRRPHAPITRGTTVLSLSPEYEERYIKVATTPDLDDDFWKDEGKTEAERLYQWKDIPIFFLSGWYGNHLTANFEKYKILKDRFKSPVKMLVGHWEHNMNASFAGRVDFGLNADADVFRMLRLTWFDQTLKGMDTGLFESPPLQYFVMGGGSGTRNVEGRLKHGGMWAHSETWPPAHVRPAAYYLHGDGTLSPEGPEVERSSTTYTFDPRDPVPTVGGNFMEYTRPDFKFGVKWMPDGAAQDQRANAEKPFCRDNLPLSTREDVLVFQTPPLTEDVEVTGELLARLWVSSTAPDTDFTVKLMDVYPSSGDYPEGFAMNLQDAVVRMRYRNGRRKEDLMEPGEIHEVELPFHSTSNLFKKGHRIRVDVSSSNFPRIDVNLNTGGPLGVPGPVRTAENTLYHDKDHPSRVILPVAEKGQSKAGRPES